MFQWSCVGCTNCGLRTMQSGTFSDGSGASNYPNQARCEWMIAPSGAQAISITFSVSSIAYADYLQVYECGDILCLQSQLLTSISSTGSLTTNQISATGFVKVVFTSDYYDTGGNGGFDASWSSVRKLSLLLFISGQHLQPNRVQNHRCHKSGAIFDVIATIIKNICMSDSFCYRQATPAQDVHRVACVLQDLEIS